MADPSCMRRGISTTSTCSNKRLRSEASVDEHELKELFTDPVLRESQKPKRRTHSSDSTSVHERPITEITNITDHFGEVSGRSLITRRITIAGGFLDIALFSANCEQLKFVLELGHFHLYHNQVLGLLITSLILQLLVGLTMFLLGCHVMKKSGEETYSNFLNHLTMGLVAMITIVNIFIGTFGPKGTVMARCLGAFAFPNSSGPVWTAYLNATRSYMTSNN